VTGVQTCALPILISLGSLDNGGAGGVGAFPAFNLDPLALLQILVVLEEVLDLLDQQRRQVGVFLHVLVQLSQLVVGDGDQLGVAAGFVGHVQHADRAAADDRARSNRVGGYYQHVQGVAVVGQGVRDKAV